MSPEYLSKIEDVPVKNNVVISILLSIHFPWNTKLTFKGINW